MLRLCTPPKRKRRELTHLQIASAARQDLQGHIESITLRVELVMCEEMRATWVLEEEGASLLWRLLLMLLRERCAYALLSSIIVAREMAAMHAADERPGRPPQDGWQATEGPAVGGVRRVGR